MAARDARDAENQDAGRDENNRPINEEGLIERIRAFQKKPAAEQTRQVVEYLTAIASSTVTDLMVLASSRFQEPGAVAPEGNDDAGGDRRRDLGGVTPPPRPGAEVWAAQTVSASRAESIAAAAHIVASVLGVTRLSAIGMKCILKHLFGYEYDGTSPTNAVTGILYGSAWGLKAGACLKAFVAILEKAPTAIMMTLFLTLRSQQAAYQNMFPQENLDHGVDYVPVGTPYFETDSRSLQALTILTIAGAIYGGTEIFLRLLQSQYVVGVTSAICERIGRCFTGAREALGRFRQEDALLGEPLLTAHDGSAVGTASVVGEGSPLLSRHDRSAPAHTHAHAFAPAHAETPLEAASDDDTNTYHDPRSDTASDNDSDPEDSVR